MFEIGWTEILVIAIVLIVVVGPKDLPPMLRAFGKMTSKMRSMAGEFRSQFDEALREADLDDVKKTLADARSLNPINQIRDAVNPLKAAGEDIRANLEKSVKPDAPAAAPPAEPAKVEIPEPALKLPDTPPVVAAPAAIAGAAEAARPAKTGRSPRKAAGEASKPATAAGTRGKPAATDAAAKPTAKAAATGSATPKPAAATPAKAARTAKTPAKARKTVKGDA